MQLIRRMARGSTPVESDGIVGSLAALPSPLHSLRSLLPLLRLPSPEAPVSYATE
jgi:hypothetical protein